MRCSTASAARTCRRCATLAQELAGIVGSDPNLSSPIFDWNEPARVVRVNVLQDKARQLGISSADIATALNGTVGGVPITQVRDSIYLVNVTVRASERKRGAIETLQNLQLFNKTGQPVPLAAIATFQYEMEQPAIWRRNRLPTVTVKADILDGRQPATVVGQLESAVKSFTERLPAGYRLAIGGPVEESAKSQTSHLRGGAADAAHHGDHPDAATAEFQPALPGRVGGAAGR